jgi:hypothetical protein
MDYLEHYKKLIESRLKLNRTKKDGVYYEKHHIVPKSLGGSNSPRNLILLTAKEHYIAHLLLHYARPHSKYLAYGLWCLCTMSNGYKIKSSRLFSYLRENILTTMNPSKHLENRKKSSNRMLLNNPMKGKISPNKGINVSKLYGDKISKGLKKYFENNPNSFSNKKHSKESIEKIIQNHKMSKKVIINNVIYNSVLDASRKLNIGHNKLYNHLSGKHSNTSGIKLYKER